MFGRSSPIALTMFTAGLLLAQAAPARALGPTVQAGSQPEPSCVRPVLTLVEAAALLRVEPDDLVRLAERQAVPGRAVGSDWRFGCEALLRWLAGRTDDVDGSAGRPQDPIGDAPQDRPAEDVTLRGQRILLGPGDVVLDAGVFYSRTDDLTLADVGTGIGLATQRREQVTTVLQGRVGLASETELVVGVSYLGQIASISFDARRLAEARQHEFLGGTVGFRRTLVREGSRRPAMIATVDGYLPAGDRPYVAGAGLVLVKSLDPVAVFVTANYFRAFRPGSSSSIGTFAEHSGAVSAGYALALNDTLATSLSVSGAFAGSLDRPEDGQVRPPGRFNARVGVTAWLRRGLYVEPSLTVALAGPGSGVTFGVTLPYSF